MTRNTENILSGDKAESLTAKRLDEGAAKVMGAILAAGKTVIDNSNGIHAPVLLATGHWHKEFRIISLSQRNVYENGAEFRTELLFLHERGKEEYIPFGYRNDFTGTETCSIALNSGIPHLLDEGLQEDHTAFASMWLRDIGFKHWLGR